MINTREEILKSLPIENFFIWYSDNWDGTGFQVWADEVIEMQKERVVKIVNGRVELINIQITIK